MAEKAADAAGADGGAQASASKRTAVPVSADDGDISEEIYLGVVKSYNDRRGFGFLACTQTADTYGRDVYMPKAEATQAAMDAALGGLDGEDAKKAAIEAQTAQAAAAVAAASAARTPAVDKDGKPVEGKAAEKPPPAPRLAEEDLVLFRVRLSVEGYPQAACVRKLRKLSGTIAEVPEDEGADGAIRSEGAFAAFGIKEVVLRKSHVGQVRLAVGDEVTFCMPEATEKGGPPAEASAGPPEAKMVFLARTTRSSGSVLGCFTLGLPRTGGGEGEPERPNLMLDCHAFGDKLILAGLPADLEEAELMRFFSKQNASGVIVARARTCSFASVSFPGTVDVARFLGRTAHAFADEKDTRIARLCHLTPSADTARLPALPAPSLTAGEEIGSLLVVWSPLVLATAYSVELRPAPYGGPPGGWVTVDVASNRLGDSNHRFDSTCSSCKVAGLNPGTPYEARVSYFTECGTRSEASEATDACLPNTGASNAGAHHHEAGGALGTGAGLGAAEGFGAGAASMQPDFGGFGASYPPPGQVPMQAMPPAPPWPAWDGMAAMPTAPPPPMQDGYPAPLPAYLPSPSSQWRSPTGCVVPSPSAPELRPADEHGFAVSIQWPAVLQAAAYVVELREAGSSAFERFVRSAPEAKLGTLVELRVGGLRPGPPPGRVYVAQVRTVGTDGSESQPSPPGWSPPLPSSPASGAVATAATAVPGSVLSADAPAWQPSSVASALTMPSASAPPAPPPAAPPPQPPAPCLGNWAPPPWLGTPGPSVDAAAVLGSSPGAPDGPPGYSPNRMPLGTPPPDAAANVTWGAPGAPPPPPMGPPPVVPPGGRLEDPPQKAAGADECLILD